MKFYEVKEEYVGKWSDYDDIVVVSEDEIKSLSSEWETSVRTLKKQVKAIKHDTVKVERYYINDFIVEVEEKDDPVGGHMFDFWITKEKSGMKSYALGMPTNQTQAYINPKVYSKDEILEMIFSNIQEHATFFEDEVDRLEEAWEAWGERMCK